MKQLAIVFCILSIYVGGIVAGTAQSFGTVKKKKMCADRCKRITHPTLKQKCEKECTDSLSKRMRR